MTRHKLDAFQFFTDELLKLILKTFINNVSWNFPLHAWNLFHRGDAEKSRNIMQYFEILHKHLTIVR